MKSSNQPLAKNLLVGEDVGELQLFLQNIPESSTEYSIIGKGPRGQNPVVERKGAPSRWCSLVVALTAFAMKGDDLKARAAGCDGYVTKPIDTRKLLVQVAEFLERKSKIANLKSKIQNEHPCR